jgi:K+-transporting ATPase ATPase A chain
MLVLFLIGTIVAWSQEAAGNPVLHQLGVAGGNMEGKEVRFGIAASSLFAAVTTAASCGAVNAMHDSFTALGGLVPLFNIQLGEVVVGGVGAGIYGFLLFAILAVFVAGLMVGRTPEYVGKKIEAREVKLAVLAIAVLPLVILGGTALASVLPEGLAGPLNKGPHGFSEILYGFTSAVGNNGSAFAGLTAGTPFYNGALGIAMWLGRFFVIVPMLAIAGSLAAKKYTPETAGSFPTTGPLWIGLLVGTILILGGLTFLPSLALGPIADHLAMIGGHLS